MKAVIYDLNEDFNKNEEYFFRDVQTSFAIGILFIFLSITGAIAILLGKLQERKKEFGIKKALSASNSRLAVDLLKEIMLISFLSAILSIASILSIYKGEITKELILFNIVMIVVITIIIGIIPIVSVIKEEVVYMIRER